MARYRIRIASTEDVAALPDIERAAATVFLDYLDVVGLDREALQHTNSIANFAAAQQAGLLWTATGEHDAPIGFAMLHRYDDVVHLHEIDVLPEHARQGIGGALLDRVRAWAREQGATALTLTTYRDIPWNAPFYARHGFRIVDEQDWTPALRRIREQERILGWRMSARVVMRMDLG